MRPTLIHGTIAVPSEDKQLDLHRQIGYFASELQRPKDHSEIRRDRRQSAPKGLLPMVF